MTSTFPHAADGSPDPCPTPRTSSIEHPTAVVIMLDPDGLVEVVDLLTHPRGRRILDELIDSAGNVEERHGDAGNVVRLPVAQVLRALPDFEVSAPPAWQPVVIEDRPRAGASGSVELSFREFEVLRLIVEGFSNQEIADQLYLGINTIKSYVRTSYRKIQVTKRAEAVRWGFLHGLGYTGDVVRPDRSH
jgi:DNA-binding CsgD family transcriptional regulator